MTASAPRRGWIVVVPVKEAERGKTRLAVDGVDRADLARAIALDTISAAASCDEVERVIVVTNDAEVSGAFDDARIEVCAEGHARGLDAAVATGIARAGAQAARAALLGDLPALRSADLGAALRLAAAHDRSVIADAEGTGSTLVTAAPDAAWTSAFGADSFARHVSLGCTPLELPDASTLRRDVDTADQLTAAAALGLGPRTAALLGD